MKINIPSFHSITLADFIDYHAAPDDVSKMVHITKWKRDKVLQLKPETIEKTIELYENELNMTGDFPRRFKVADRQYGFVPNLETMSLGEFTDLDAYLTKLTAKDYSELDKMLCVLFRPIKLQLGQLYTIRRYNLGKIDRYITDIRTMPMYHVHAVIAFFLTLENQQIKDFPQYLLQRLKTRQTQIERHLSVRVSDGSTS
jgi:hypothetical protein